MNNKQDKKVLEEGLRKGDLQEMIYPIFEIDTFRSKMGEDKDVCVLTFQSKDRYPAKDFMEFVEKGYPFVLDADVSAGENKDGEYSIFVEIERTPKLADDIMEMLYGLSRLTDVNDWEYKFYKNNELAKATTENLRSIPNSPKMYEASMQKFRTEEVKSFFDKTLMDDLTLDENVITIHKPFGNVYKFEMVDEGINEGINEAPAVDEHAMAEIFWLTKVMGNYDINKYGENFLFTNGSKTKLLKRVN